MAIGTIQRVKVVGSKTVPRLVTAAITFADDATATVNATDLEASKILGLLGFTAWGAGATAPERGYNVYATTPFSEAGVTQVALEIFGIKNNALDGTEKTVTMLFECE